MKTIKLNDGHFFKILDDAGQLPAEQYKDFQKYQLLESGIGSDMQSVSDRFSRVLTYLSPQHLEKARKEIENLYYTHYFILEKISPSQMSFACLVHSIDDDKIDDFSSESLEAIIKKLSEYGLTQEIVDDFTSDVKKKFSLN